MRPPPEAATLTVLENALKAAGKDEDAKAVRARNDKVAFVIPKPFAGRKAKSDRVVLVELFTGAQCPPCVAADLGFDALDKTYKPTEVVLLQYHLHIPGPDPLTNADTEARAKFYGPAIGGTPTVFFNGKPGAEGGGSFAAAQAKYEEFQALVNPLLEKPAPVKLKATATLKDGKIAIKADVSDLQKPSDDVKLRLVLVEEEVAYQGGNKLPTHHSVVRAFPGGKRRHRSEGKDGYQRRVHGGRRGSAEATQGLPRQSVRHSPLPQTRPTARTEEVACGGFRPERRIGRGSPGRAGRGPKE